MCRDGFRRRGTRQGSVVLIIRIGFLDGLDGGNLPPGGDQSVRARGKVMFNEAVQPAKAITGNRGIHVMLGVIIHVPVEKFRQRIQGERPAAEPEIRDVILQADMLRVVAKEEEPSSIKRREGADHGQEPEMGVKGKGDDQSMTGQQGAGPADGSPPLRAVLRKERQLPFAFHLAASDPDRVFDRVK